MWRSLNIYEDNRKAVYDAFPGTNPRYATRARAGFITHDNYCALWSDIIDRDSVHVRLYQGEVFWKWRTFPLHSQYVLRTGDAILDPFCGYAMTLVAADRLRHQWVGIDLSVKAGDLVTERIKADQGGLFEEIHVRDDIPQRTDLGPPLTAKQRREHKHILYGLQVGRCNGCNIHFERLQDFHMDRIVARARGGTDHAHNFQLLWGHCNSVKGKKTQAEFMAEMAEKRTDYSWM